MALSDWIDQEGIKEHLKLDSKIIAILITLAVVRGVAYLALPHDQGPTQYWEILYMWASLALASFVVVGAVLEGIHQFVRVVRRTAIAIYDEIRGKSAVSIAI